MTDADRMVAHGMGYESAVDASAEGETHTSGTVAAPGHEEALTDLVAENERLKRALRVLAEENVAFCSECPEDRHWWTCIYACGGMSPEETKKQAVECWCKWAMAAEADARKAGDAQ